MAYPNARRGLPHGPDQVDHDHAVGRGQHLRPGRVLELVVRGSGRRASGDSSGGSGVDRSAVDRSSRCRRASSPALGVLVRHAPPVPPRKTVSSPMSTSKHPAPLDGRGRARTARQTAGPAPAGPSARATRPQHDRVSALCGGQAGRRGRLAVRRARHQLLPVPADPRRPGQAHDRRPAGVAPSSSPPAARNSGSTCRCGSSSPTTAARRSPGDLGTSYQFHAPVIDKIAEALPSDAAAHRHGLRDLHGDRPLPRHPVGLAPRRARRPAQHRPRADAVLGPVVLARPAAHHRPVGRHRARSPACSRPAAWSRAARRASPTCSTSRTTSCCRCITLVAVEYAQHPAGHALRAARRDGQRLPDDRAGQGAAATTWCGAGTPCRTRCCRR